MSSILGIDDDGAVEVSNDDDDDLIHAGGGSECCLCRPFAVIADIKVIKEKRQKGRFAYVFDKTRWQKQIGGDLLLILLPYYISPPSTLDREQQ